MEKRDLLADDGNQNMKRLMEEMRGNLSSQDGIPSVSADICSGLREEPSMRGICRKCLEGFRKGKQQSQNVGQGNKEKEGERRQGWGLVVTGRA